MNRFITHGGNDAIVLEVFHSGKEFYNNGRATITMAEGNGGWYVGIEHDGRLYSPNMYADYSTAKRYFDREVYDKDRSR